jgi:hypothetical protein
VRGVPRWTELRIHVVLWNKARVQLKKRKEKEKKAKEKERRREKREKRKEDKSVLSPFQVRRKGRSENSKCNKWARSLTGIKQNFYSRHLARRRMERKSEGWLQVSDVERRQRPVTASTRGPKE